MDIIDKSREAEHRAKLKKAKKIVIKIGTSSLMYKDAGINLRRIHKLSEIISDLMNEGMDVILVSSGAIGVGVKMLRLPEKPKTVEGRQAVAAVGQVDLMKLYSMAFADYGYSVGQILLTKNILDNEESKNHSVNTFTELLKMRIVPIVNENDTVAVDEIKFGDNDSLSYMVATINKADLLIILTDIDGFYSNNPNEDPTAVLYHTIEDLSEKIEEVAGGAGSKLGTGGMLTKVHASRLAAAQGINAVIANGDDPKIIHNILDGMDVGTLFVARGKDE